MTTDLTRLLEDTLIDVTNPFGDKGTEHAAAERMHAALVAVVGIHQPEWAHGHYRCQTDRQRLDHRTPLCPTVQAITTALTKGDGRG